jgi:hypothetical protein
MQTFYQAFHYVVLLSPIIGTALSKAVFNSRFYTPSITCTQFGTRELGMNLAFHINCPGLHISINRMSCFNTTTFLQLSELGEKIP